MSRVRQIVWEGVSGKLSDRATNHKQLKYDGSQYHLHLLNGKGYAFTSRRVSKKTNKLNEKIDHFPEFTKKLIDVKGETIFVGEVVAEHLREDFRKGKILNKKGEPIPWSRRSNFVASIMNSNVENIESNPLKYVIFDIVMYNGDNLYGFTYNERYKILKKLFDSAGKYGEKLNNGGSIFRVQSIRDYKSMKETMKQVCSKGFEGIVVKDADSNASMKLKGEKDADCIIIGYVDGTNKYAKNRWVGSLIVGALNKCPKYIDKRTNKIGSDVVESLIEDGYLVEVGRISGFDEELRAHISKRKKQYLGSVVHCKFMNWTGNKMRHPRIGEKQIREDKLIKRCTLEQFG